MKTPLSWLRIRHREVVLSSDEGEGQERRTNLLLFLFAYVSLRAFVLCLTSETTIG